MKLRFTRYIKRHVHLFSDPQARGTHNSAVSQLNVNRCRKGGGHRIKLKELVAIFRSIINWKNTVISAHSILDNFEAVLDFGPNLKSHVT